MIMTPDEIVGSWKNEDYRLSLSVDEQALLPENPAGLIELSDQELLGIDGGTSTLSIATVILSIVFTIVGSVVVSHNYCPAE
jgi:mersacidin/lichenicidin family type 2 lantibiotic